MSLRIICQHCSGELQVPDDSAGSRVRCPFCERIFVCPLAFAPVGGPARSAASSAASSAAAPTTYDDAGAWSPRQEELLDESVPWYLLLGSLTPVALLTLVDVEPIAIGLAAALTVAGLIVATRRSWAILTRVMGLFALTLLAMSAAAAAHAFGQGSLANLQRPVAPVVPVTPPEPVGPDLDQAEWKTWTMPKGEGYTSDVTLLAPGNFTYTRRPEFGRGLDIHVFLLSFPRQKVKFALQSFDVAAGANPTESAEIKGLTVVHEVIANLMPEFHPDPEQIERPLYCGQHPGYEEQRIMVKTTKRIVLNVYLVRDKAYVLSVGAEDFDETVKTAANKFFASFQLVSPAPPMRAAIAEGPDAMAYPRPTPRTSLCGHWKSLPPGELTFSPDGSWLVTGLALDQVVLWNMKTGLGKFLTSTAGFDTFAVDPSGKNLVTPVPNGLKPPDLVRFPPLKDYPAPPLAFRNSDVIAFKGNTVIVALDTNITGWNNEPGDNFGDWLWESPRAAKSTIVSLVLSRDGRLMATASAEEPAIKLWDASRNGPPTAVKEWDAHKKVEDGSVAVQQLAFSPALPAGTTPVLASAGADGTAKIWSLADINNPQLAATLPHEYAVGCLDFSNDGQRLATGDGNGVVRIWDRASGKLLIAFRASAAMRPVQAVRFSPDDSLLACAVTLGNQRTGVNLFETRSLPAAANPQTDEPPLLKK